MDMGAQNVLILNRTELIRKFSSEALLFCKPGNTFTVNEWKKSKYYKVAEGNRHGFENGIYSLAVHTSGIVRFLRLIMSESIHEII